MLYDLQINVFGMGDVEFLGVFIINFENCRSKYVWKSMHLSFL